MLYLALFVATFSLLQNSTIYENTLGRISQNYERSGDWDHVVVTKVSKPYVKITEENFQHWDAAIYKCISEQMYVQKEECFGLVSGAFFPLFPVIWKALHLNSVGISLLNYLLFMISIMLLINNFMKADDNSKLILFLLAITLPSTVNFMIPYTEALFMFTSTLAFIGMQKRNYKLYFIATVAVALVRPATMFVFMAFFTIELLIFLRNKNLKNLLREVIVKLSPFVIGYCAAIFIQFLYSGSFRTYLDAQKHWSADFGIIRTFTDWSVEGFGLSVFAIFFVAIPSLLYLLYSVLKTKWEFRSMTEIFKSKEGYSLFSYMALSSFLYVSGLLVFAILVSGGNLHSFSRFVLCSPAFYCILIFAFNNLQDESRFLWKVLAFDGCLLMFFLFLSGVEYGGDRTDFSHWGSYLFIANFTFFLFFIHIHERSRIWLLTFIVLGNLIWNTYLFNCFLSDSWLFT